MVTTTDTDDPVQMIVDILSDSSVGWTLTAPDVLKLWEVDAQQRLKNPDPTVYVWSPVDGSLDRFSADGVLQTDDRTVECLIMTYDEAETFRYAEDVIDELGNYIDDNTRYTSFEDIEPTAVSDQRGDKLFGQSDHYVATVEIETGRLRTTRDLDDTVFDGAFNATFA